jgi:hypothetical protein
VKWFYSTLLLVGVGLSLACGGLKGIVTGGPSAAGDKDGVKLKANQVKGFLLSTDGKTGEITLETDAGTKKYMRADGCKFYEPYESTVPEPNIGRLLKGDVILTLDKKDGKELVTEIRAAPRTLTLTTRGSRVEGLCKGRDGASGDVIVEVNGVEKRYASDDRTRFYDQLGNPITSQQGRAYANVMVEMAVEQKGGRDYVIELRPKK